MAAEKYEIHPAAELFPMLEESALQELAADIKANGLVHPAVLYQGKVLDGRNRLAACKLACVAPRYTTWDGPSPTTYVLSANLKRRHLTPQQRAALAAKSLPMFEAEAKERQRAAASRGGSAPKVKVRDEPTRTLKPVKDDSKRAIAQAAKATGAGIGSAKVMAAVQKKAPEVVQLVADGAASVADARRIASLPAPQREEVVDLVHGGTSPREAFDAIAQARAASEAIGDAAVQMKTAATALLNKTQKVMALLRKHGASLGGVHAEMIRMTMLNVRSVVTDCINLTEGKN